MNKLGNFNKTLTKVNEVLLEDSTLKRHYVTDNPYQSLSVATLKRDYKFVTTVNSLVDIYLKTSETREGFLTFRGFSKPVTEDGRRNLVFHIEFKYSAKMPIPRSMISTKRAYQVDLVESSSGIESVGVATAVYKYLTTQNFTVVSDTTQYRGGQAIWKKLARDSSVKVGVFDLKSESYLETNYDGSNVSEVDIWSTEYGSHVASDILLTLTKK